MEKINKTLFLKARSCPKAAYLYAHEPELIAENPNLGAIFRKSKEVEMVARGLFEPGIDVDAQSLRGFNENEKYTRSLVEKGTEVIYQGCFESDNKRCKIDIMIQDKKSLKIYTVKSSTSLQDEHILLMAFQKYILEEIYPNIKLEVYLIHLNKNYVRKESLELEKLFIVENLTNRVRLARPLVDRYIDLARKIISGKSCPKVDIGTHCTKPYECEFKSHCWAHIPENSVFDISRLWEVKKFNLYAQGIVEMKDIPRTVKMNEKQWLQVDCALQNKFVIDPIAIKDFLDEVKFPIYCMDMETIQPVIPLYTQTSVYAQIPVQFSVHCMDSDRNVTHSEYLAKNLEDQRLQFLKNLLVCTGKKGTVFVYNKSFEVTRLNELAQVYPEYSEEIENLIFRIQDLMIPFSQHYLYHKNQKGSVSLKAVLPAWISSDEVSYKNLEISNGAIASEEFIRMAGSTSRKEKEAIRKNLLRYCAVDTMATVKIFQLLEYISFEHQKNAA